MDYISLIPVLTKAIQEQQTEIEALTSQNKELSRKVVSADQSAKLVAELSAEINEIKRALKMTSAQGNSIEASK